MKQFNVPLNYRSPLISAIKNKRRNEDKLKKDFSPALLNFGPVHIYLARHFGFCYGVENAIEIAFKTVEENKGKRIFLLSEMIHNPHVNNDLKENGVAFLHDTLGNELIPFSAVTKDDIVIIPAFGTTLEMEALLAEKGIETKRYNTTCPFVEKVWNRSEQIAAKGYTIVIHGKPVHEETRATFSHAAHNAPAVVVKDMADAVELGKFISGEYKQEEFYTRFKGKYSDGFDVTRHLQKIGVVNQTTMLAADTQGIADYLKNIMALHFTEDNAEKLSAHFADTRDTLCYATNDNQTAVYEMLKTGADLAIIVGGYNSSNTSHLVELCEEKLPSYFITEADNLTPGSINHYNLHKKQELVSYNYLPEKKPVKILLTSGASCPDAHVERVIDKLLSFFPGAARKDEIERLYSGNAH